MLEKICRIRLVFDATADRRELLPHTPTHTKELKAAVLDIFNKLKPRYKKMYISYRPPSPPPPPPTTLSVNCDKHCFPPQNETTIQTKDQCRILNISQFQSDLKAGPLHSQSSSHLGPQSKLCLSAVSHSWNVCPPKPPQNTHMLHVCRHLG